MCPGPHHADRPDPRPLTYIHGVQYSVSSAGCSALVGREAQVLSLTPSARSPKFLMWGVLNARPELYRPYTHTQSYSSGESLPTPLPLPPTRSAAGWGILSMPWSQSVVISHTQRSAHAPQGRKRKSAPEVSFVLHTFIFGITAACIVCVSVFPTDDTPPSSLGCSCTSCTTLYMVVSLHI